MPRGESGSSPKKRAAATDLHERLSKDELIKRLKVSIRSFLNVKNIWKLHLYQNCSELTPRRLGFNFVYTVALHTCQALIVV